MFNSLSERLSKTLQSMGKKARLTEDNIASTLKEVRKALAEADQNDYIIYSDNDEIPNLSEVNFKKNKMFVMWAINIKLKLTMLVNRSVRRNIIYSIFIFA